MKEEAALALLGGPAGGHRYTSLLLMLCLFVFASAGLACAPDDQEDDLADASKVSNLYELQAMNEDLSGNYILVNDIDASQTKQWNDGAGFAPIGELKDPFTGTLDGQGYEIAGLYIDRPTEYGVGLFGYVGEGGQVRNVGLTGVNVTSDSSVGGLAGSNFGLVTRCSTTGGVVSAWRSGGGLVGSNRGTVSESYSTSDAFAGNERAGGLVGSNRGTISDSYARGRVGSTGSAGGLAGRNYDGTVVNSYAMGKVFSNGASGGLVGHHEGTVTSSFWDVDTSGQATSVGGVGKSTAEMRTKSTFVEAGWDFDNVWDISDINDGYPFLRWQVKNRE